ncbi:MAG: hypothetical protein HY907_12380 [Deltaproteobacteria bacterium]|nr:hypothetical protein [Deltaproteobacteria bacterium]
MFDSARHRSVVLAASALALIVLAAGCRRESRLTTSALRRARVETPRQARDPAGLASFDNLSGPSPKRPLPDLLRITVPASTDRQSLVLELQERDYGDLRGPTAEGRWRAVLCRPAIGTGWGRRRSAVGPGAPVGVVFTVHDLTAGTEETPNRTQAEIPRFDGFDSYPVHFVGID